MLKRFGDETIENLDAEIKARIRKALGVDALASSGRDLVLRGSVTSSGSLGTFDLLFAPDGRFVRRIQAPIGDLVGFDGTIGWTVDWLGIPRLLDLHDLLWSQLGIWVWTGLWTADHLPIRIVDADPVDDRTLVLTIAHKDGPLQPEVTVDTDSWLPVSLRLPSIQGEHLLEYGDYSDLGAFRVPGRVLHTTEGIEALSYRVESIAEADHAASDYAPVTIWPETTRFDPSVAPNLEVERAPTGHFLIRPTVNGSDVGWFILDSGGSASTLGRRAAAGLQLPQLGTTTLASMFGIESTPIRRAASVEIGPMTIENPLFVEMEFGAVEQAFGRQIGGLIGYDLFCRSIVEIEVARSHVAVYDPMAFEAEDLEWVPLLLHYQTPVVYASFAGGGRGLFRLDLGASGMPAGNVVFHTPAVTQLGLVDGKHVDYARVGALHVAFGKIDWFELAGHCFENPAVAYSVGEGGVFDDPFLAGNIGADFLEPFRIVLDYPNRRVAFVLL